MQTTIEEAVQTINILKSSQIAAPIELVFETVLEELGPGSQMPDGKPFPMKIEPWVGGRWYRDLGEMGGYKAGHLWGHVQVIKAPNLLEIVGQMPMSFPAINHVQYRLKAEGNGTLLTLHHRAMGLIPQDFKQGMPDGWEHGVKRIKLVAEGKVARKNGGAH
ncbi:MAG: SRPBCC domain-containing protein [Phycisphaerales bacterium]